MRITETRLRRIIRQELRATRTLREGIRSEPKLTGNPVVDYSNFIHWLEYSSGAAKDPSVLDNYTQKIKKLRADSMEEDPEYTRFWDGKLEQVRSGKVAAQHRAMAKAVYGGDRNRRRGGLGT